MILRDEYGYSGVQCDGCGLLAPGVEEIAKAHGLTHLGWQCDNAGSHKCPTCADPEFKIPTRAIQRRAQEVEKLRLAMCSAETVFRQAQGVYQAALGGQSISPDCLSATNRDMSDASIDSTVVKDSSAS